MDQETEVVQAPEPKAEPQQSLQERMTKSVAEAWTGATVDGATAATPSAEESQVAKPDGVEQVAVETTNQESTSASASGDDTPFTPEQLRDKAFWGGLDKNGWAKAARLHPVETELVKAAQSAASRIVNAARKEAPAEPTPTQTQTTEESELDPELQELLDAIDLGTPKERIEALKRLTQMTVESVPEVRASREQTAQATLMQQAHELAVNGNAELGIPAFPELDQLDEADLNAQYVKDPDAQAIAKIGTPQALALAMRKVGQAVLSGKHAADRQHEAEQEKLRRNANTPASNAVTSGGGAPIPQKPQTPLEFVQSEWNKASVRASS